MRCLVDSDRGELRKERERRERSFCEIDAGGGEGRERVSDDFVDDDDLLEVEEEETGRTTAIVNVKNG